MCVDFCSLRTAVAEQSLNIAQIGPSFEQMGGKTMAQAVQTYIFSNARFHHSILKHFSDAGFTVLPASGSLKESFFWLVFLVIVSQQTEDLS